MGLLDLFRREKPEASVAPAVRAMVGEAAEFFGFDDPRFLEFIRGGGAAMTDAGISVSVDMALRNTTVLRCVSVIAFSIGMLPLHLIRKDDKQKAVDHPVFRLLHRRPNAWQTAFEFRSLMQQRALVEGDAYALIVRSGNRIMQLVPLLPERVRARQTNDWTIEYIYDPPKGGQRVLRQRDVFHLRYGISKDGFTGVSLVKQAAEAIALAIQAERAAARIFRQGVMAGGALKMPDGKRLSPEAYERLQASLEAKSGAQNAHKWLILEEGLDATPFAGTGREGQTVEMRKQQVEDIARPFGVPRPLLAMDDTSWGSGIAELGQFFIRYALNPWFEAWQQAGERSLLTEAEADIYELKFNPGALERGNMKDQGDFFAKGLGAGGHQPFLEVDEVRDWLDLPHSDDLPPPLGQSRGEGNEPSQAA